MAEFNLIFPPDSQVDRRVRGEHSTVCKCPRPEWVPPERYKLLPGEMGRIEKLYFRTDSETGKKIPDGRCLPPLDDPGRHLNLDSQHQRDGTGQ